MNKPKSEKRSGKREPGYGAPPKYESPEEMQKKIDAYFESCKGHVLEFEDPETGEKAPIYDKSGQPVIVDVKPPTITGLALALGFTSRQALLNYQAKKDFIDTVTRAKSRVEEYTETRLFDRDGVNGAKFSLANNFKGWSEKQEVKQELTGRDGGAVKMESGVQIYLPDNQRGGIE